MGEQRVLILSAESLLGDSIRHLLEGDTGIDLVGVAPLMPAPQEAISRLRPDVVIIVDADPPTDSATALSTLLETYSDLPMIRVGLREPNVRIYHSQEVPATLLTLKEVLHSHIPKPV